MNQIVKDFPVLLAAQESALAALEARLTAAAEFYENYFPADGFPAQGSPLRDYINQQQGNIATQRALLKEILQPGSSEKAQQGASALEVRRSAWRALLELAEDPEKAVLHVPYISAQYQPQQKGAASVQNGCDLQRMLADLCRNNHFFRAELTRLHGVEGDWHERGIRYGKLADTWENDPQRNEFIAPCAQIAKKSGAQEDSRTMNLDPAPLEYASPDEVLALPRLLAELGYGEIEGARTHTGSIASPQTTHLGVEVDHAGPGVSEFLASHIAPQEEMLPAHLESSDEIPVFVEGGDALPEAAEAALGGEACAAAPAPISGSPTLLNRTALATLAAQAPDDQPVRAGNLGGTYLANIAASLVGSEDEPPVPVPVATGGPAIPPTIMLPPSTLPTAPVPADLATVLPVSGPTRKVDPRKDLQGPEAMVEIPAATQQMPSQADVETLQGPAVPLSPSPAPLPGETPGPNVQGATVRSLRPPPHYKPGPG